MAGDAYLIRDGPVSVPLSYAVPQSGELLPLSVRATLNGANAGQPYYAVVQLVAPSGRVLGNYITQPIAAGASADVTWFPGAELDQGEGTQTGGGTSGGSSGGVLTETIAVTDGSTTVTAANTLNFTSGASVSSGGTGIADVAVTSASVGFSGARVYRSTNQSIPNLTDTVIIFDTVRFDVGGYSNIAAHPTRLTAPITGYYLIGGTVAFDNGDFYCQLVLLINNDFINGQISGSSTSVPSGNPNLISNAIWHMTAGDFAELDVVQSTGAAKNVLGAPPQSAQFWMTLIGV